jgi:putative spermidine/putrescine transport system substrate-binding protein
VPAECRRFTPTDPANAAVRVAQDGRWWGADCAQANADCIDMVTG